MSVLSIVQKLGWFDGVDIRLGRGQTSLQEMDDRSLRGEVGRVRMAAGDDDCNYLTEPEGQRREPKSDGGMGAAASLAKRAAGEARLKHEVGHRRQLAPE